MKESVKPKRIIKIYRWKKLKQYHKSLNEIQSYLETPSTIFHRVVV